MIKKKKIHVLHLFLKKILCANGPVEHRFKPVLFRGQLYKKFGPLETVRNRTMYGQYLEKGMRTGELLELETWIKLSPFQKLDHFIADGEEKRD